MEFIRIIFIGFGAWAVFAVLSYLIAIAVACIVDKIKVALKRKGATYV